MLLNYAVQPLDGDDCLLMIINDKKEVTTAAYCLNKDAAHSARTLLNFLFEDIDDNGNIIHPKNAEDFFAAFYEAYRKNKDEQAVNDVSSLPSSGIIH